MGPAACTMAIDAGKPSSKDAPLSEERLREVLDALREGEQRCTALVSQLKDYALFGLDPAGRVTSWNEGVFQVLGYAKHEFIGMAFARLFPPEAVADGVPERELAAAAERGAVSDDCWILRRDGTRIWVSGVTTALHDPAGHLIGYSKLMCDQTRWKKADDALRQNERMLNQAQEVANIGCWEAEVRELEDLTKNPIRCSDQLLRIFGYEPGSVTPTTNVFLERLHPDDRDELLRRSREAFRTGRRYQFEFRIILPDGTQRILEAIGTVDYDEHGRPLRMLGTTRDVTELAHARSLLKQTAEAERARAEELGALMDAVPAAVWITRDRECRTMTGSRAAYRLLRMPEGSNLSATEPADERPFRITRDGAELALDELPVRRAARGNEVRGFEEEIRFHDGSVLYLYGDAVPLRDAGGRIYGAIGAFIDITARKEMEQRLRDVDRRKDEFLATLGHELRNPLAPVRNAARILREAAGADPQVKWAADVIDRQVRQLARLVDDLLDVARIARGHIALQKEWTNLGAIVERALEMSRPLIEARRHALNVHLPPQPVAMEADPARLAQVFSNLLNNAAKFTGEGGRIDVIAESSDLEIIVRVRDTGAGIAPDMLPRVFDLFAQADPAAARAQDGLGIGLTLVRSLVEMHGGQVTAHSAGRGRGAEFVVRMPRYSGSRQARPVAQRDEIRPEAVRHRILVIDDNADAAESIALFLSLHGHEVRTLYDGSRAAREAAAWDPDVILLDIGLPDMDGHEVARALRRQPATRDAILVALTGYGQAEDIERSRAAGFDHHLVKPVDPEALESLLRTLKRGNVRRSAVD
jgi:PAS domain S-box-containing protein